MLVVSSSETTIWHESLVSVSKNRGGDKDGLSHGHQVSACSSGSGRQTQLICERCVNGDMVVPFALDGRLRFRITVSYQRLAANWLLENTETQIIMLL